MTVAWFGPKWDAPITDDSPECKPPLGEKCIQCQEPILEGERGVTMPYLTIDDKTREYLNRRGAVHLECHMRSVLGDVAHLERRCICFGGDDHDETDGRSYRDGARDVMTWLAEHRSP